MFQRGLKQIFILSAVVLQASFCQNRQGQLAISEVMFYPSASNSEFIELFNTSSTDTIDLTGCSIIYHTSSPDTIIPAGRGMLLLPLSYAVIFEGDYELTAGIYSKMVPAGSLILRIKSNSFGTSGMSNTAGRTICLKGKEKDTLDIYTYTADNNSGYSDERIISDSLISGSQWANSVSFNGTPGFTNSVLGSAWHLKFSPIQLAPANPEQNNSLTFSSAVINDGFLEIASAEILGFLDKDMDSTGSPDEQFYSFSIRDILPGDSIPFSEAIGPLSAGIHRLILKAGYSGSYGNRLTSCYVFTFQVARAHAGKYDIIINEIMYAPQSGEPEWVELFNRSAHETDLRKWKISDNSAKASVTASSFIIAPGGYTVLTADTVIKTIYHIPSEIIHVNLPALNNTGDMIILSDSTGRTIDSVYYSPLWGGSKGTSLERVLADSPSVNGANWQSAELVQKATPGFINSVTPREFDLALDIFKPPDFIFIPESAEIKILIKNKGLKRSQNISLQIRRSRFPDQPPVSGELIWESALPPIEPGDSIITAATVLVPDEGINNFTAIITAEKDDKPDDNLKSFQIAGVRLNEQRGDLIINEIMYAPVSDKCEWIELFNNSSKDILFFKYKTANHTDTAALRCNPVLIHPYEYFIISSDSSLFKEYQVNCPYVITTFPQLNNQGDKIIILDSLSRVIDSLKYTVSWGGTYGISLERISPSGPSSDISNWKTSVSANKATPGGKNSVSPRDFDLTVNSFNISPLFPCVSDTLNFNAVIKNLGLKSCSFITELSEQNLYDSTLSGVLSKSPVLSLAPGDSLLWPAPCRVFPPLEEKCYIFRIIPEADEEKKNNSLRHTVIPGYHRGAVVINEIMYAPTAGRPEWIELYNYQNYSVNLHGWKLNDEAASFVIYGTGQSIRMGSGQMAVLASDSTFLNSYPDISCPVIITNLPSLNNDKDAIVIKDINGNLIDSVYYYSSWGGSNGYSLERISHLRPASDKDNWGQCRNMLKSTPGFTNSLSRKEFDLEATEIVFDPSSVPAGEDISASVKVRNCGTKAAGPFSVVFRKLELDSGNEAGLSIINNLFLHPGDTLRVSSAKFSLRCSTLVSVDVLFFTDQDTLNNRLSKVTVPGYRAGSLIINELMADPGGAEPEWLELFNNSGFGINLKGLVISITSPVHYKTVISDRDLIIAPGEYIVLSRDSSLSTYYPGILCQICRFRQLSNYSDAVSLYDQNGNLIDSVYYKKDWNRLHGRSLERFSASGLSCDSTSWAPSVSQKNGTPGAANSIAALPNYQRSSVVINEIMYDPGTGCSEFIELFNSSDEPVNIAGWQLIQKSGNYFNLSPIAYLMAPDDYFLLAADSSIFNTFSQLNGNYRCKIAGSSSFGFLKEGDRILIKDARGNVIDSLSYSDKWHSKAETKNVSLERYNPLVGSNLPSNWHSSFGSMGATPCAPNSIKPPDVSSRSGFSISPNPFSPDNDGFEDITHIDLDTGNDTEAVRIRIYNSNGSLVRTLYSRSLSSHLTIDFDGRNEQGEALRIGIYILLIERLKSGSVPSDAIKSVVVIARKL